MSLRAWFVLLLVCSVWCALLRRLQQAPCHGLKHCGADAVWIQGAQKCIDRFCAPLFVLRVLYPSGQFHRLTRLGVFSGSIDIAVAEGRCSRTLSL